MLKPLEIDVSPENWDEVREEVFRWIDENASTPEALERYFKELAERLDLPLETIEEEWQKYKRVRGGNGEGRSKNGRDSTVSELLEEILNSDTELWKTENREPFASIYVQDDGKKEDHRHIEHHPIKRGGFLEDWLRDKYYKNTRRVLSESALTDILEHLKAEARLNGRVYPVFTRVGWHEGHVYLDLTHPEWKVIEVDKTGFRLIHAEKAPVRFLRNPYQRPIPEPEPSENGLYDFLKLLNIGGDGDVATVLSWLVGVFLERGPYPPLILRGEKGAGKSTIAKLLKALVDPTQALLLAPPRNEEDLNVAGLINHVIAFDNISSLPPWLSDALSRASTGEGILKRRLYTDAEAVEIELIRPVILTGIDLNSLRDDLADRALVIEPYRISEGARRTEKSLMKNFNERRRRALWQLLAAASRALRDWDVTEESLESLPRMGDWTVWATAAASALRLEPKAAEKAYKDTQVTLSQERVEDDLVAKAVRALYDEIEPGTTRVYATTELLHELERVCPPEEREKRPKEWPANAKSLGKRLRHLAQSLRDTGVEITSRLNTKTKSHEWLITKPAANTEAGPEEPPAPNGRTALEAAPVPRATADLEAASNTAAPKATAPDENPAPKPSGFEDAVFSSGVEEYPGEDIEEYLEEDAEEGPVQLFKTPPAPPPKKKKNQKPENHRTSNSEKEDWQGLYGDKSLYQEILEVKSSEDPSKYLGIKPEEVEGDECAVIKPPYKADDSGGE